MFTGIMWLFVSSAVTTTKWSLTRRGFRAPNVKMVPYGATEVSAMVSYHVFHLAAMVRTSRSEFLWMLWFRDFRSGDVSFRVQICSATQEYIILFILHCSSLPRQQNFKAMAGAHLAGRIRGEPCYAHGSQLGTQFIALMGPFGQDDVWP